MRGMEAKWMEGGKEVCVDQLYRHAYRLYFLDGQNAANNAAGTGYLFVPNARKRRTPPDAFPVNATESGGVMIIAWLSRPSWALWLQR